jgi:hypothetical protein
MRYDRPMVGPHIVSEKCWFDSNSGAQFQSGRKAGGSSSKTVNLILNGEWIETTRPHQFQKLLLNEGRKTLLSGENPLLQLRNSK